MRILLAFSLLALGCAVDTDPDDAAATEDLIVRGDGYFTAVHDDRRCPSPMCGGWWVSPVNEDRARCADGVIAQRCYVADLDLAPTALPAAVTTDLPGETGVILRGTLSAVSHPSGRFGRLTVTEAWRPGAAVTGTPEGLIERVSTEGVSCAFLPCERLAERRVASTARPRLVAGIDLSGLTLPGDVRDRVLGDATTEAGALVRGVRVSLPGTPRIPAVRATQAYTRVRASERLCGAALRSLLEASAVRVLQRSETDAPYTAVAYEGWRTLPSDATLVRTLGLPANTPVERTTLDAVFRGMTSVDPPGDLADAHRVARVNLLAATLRAQFSEVVVYRVGTIQIRVFILGRTRCGTVAGLETLVVET